MRESSVRVLTLAAVLTLGATACGTGTSRTSLPTSLGACPPEAVGLLGARPSFADLLVGDGAAGWYAVERIDAREERPVADELVGAFHLAAGEGADSIDSVRGAVEDYEAAESAGADVVVRVTSHPRIEAGEPFAQYGLAFLDEDYSFLGPCADRDIGEPWQAH